MARRLGAPLHDATLRGSALADLDAMVWTLDEPTADVAAFTAHAVCREAREHGVKVLLSGSGGDDLFTGDVWIGQAGVDAGLADGIGHLVPVMHGIFGDKVKFTVIVPRRPLLRRLGVPGVGEAPGGRWG
jgi:hypothetical protein